MQQRVHTRTTRTVIARAKAPPAITMPTAKHLRMVPPAWRATAADTAQNAPVANDETNRAISTTVTSEPTAIVACPNMNTAKARASVSLFDKRREKTASRVHPWQADTDNGTGSPGVSHFSCRYLYFHRFRVPLGPWSSCHPSWRRLERIGASAPESLTPPPNKIFGGG